MNTETVQLSSIKTAAYNPRTIDHDSMEALKASLRKFGCVDPLIINKRTGNLCGGHQRKHAMEDMGWTEAPAVFVDLSEREEKALNVALNSHKLQGQFDGEALSTILEEIKIEMPELAIDLRMDNLAQDLGISFQLERIEPGPVEALDGEEAEAASEPVPDPPESRKLADRFGVPPFSVFDAKQGYWKERKQAWLSLGIASEVGRGENLLKFSDTVKMERKSYRGGGIPNDKYNIPNYYAKRDAGMSDEEIIAEFQAKETTMSSGTSIFDPVLCEIIYRWFAPKEGVVLDPFAGGSVRGIIAGSLGLSYHGLELRPEQVDANTEQQRLILPDAHDRVSWIQGDSRETLKSMEKIDYDLVFSCPPYANLEVYSDDPADLSNMPYQQFLEAYREIIAASIDRLADDRFACFVVGEVREKSKDGYYLNFVSDTIRAFEDAGARLYNEAILLTSIGTLAMRVNAMFTKSRKLGKTHQNVLIFCKGDPRKAAEACGSPEIPEEEAEQ